MINRFRRLMRPLGVAVALVMFAAVPAESYNPSARAGQRERAGASLWVPRLVDFNSGWDTNINAGWMTFGFDWGSELQHKIQAGGSEQIFEINAEVSCDWALPDYDPTNQGYRKDAWTTNIPSAALPYEDTIFLDDCFDGVVSYGIGVANLSALTVGQYYYATVGLKNPAGHYPSQFSKVTLKVQTGTTYDIDEDFLIGTEEDRDCAWTSGEISAWNSSASSSFADRLDASWCAWPDYNHVVVREQDDLLRTGQYKTFYLNGTENESLEQVRPPAWGYGVGTGASATKYCNDWTVAFDGNCFVQTTMVGSGSNFYQDRGWGPAGGKTAEVAVRCRDLDGSCTIQLGIWGYNGPGAGSEYSYVMETITTEDPTQWFICRLDADHYTNGYGYSAPNFTQAHNNWRWEVFQHGGSLIDVDYTFFGGKTNVQDPSLGGIATGVGEIDAGPTCTPRDSAV